MSHFPSLSWPRWFRGSPDDIQSSNSAKLSCSLTRRVWVLECNKQVAHMKRSRGYFRGHSCLLLIGWQHHCLGMKMTNSSWFAWGFSDFSKASLRFLEMPWSLADWVDWPPTYLSPVPSSLPRTTGWRWPVGPMSGDAPPVSVPTCGVSWSVTAFSAVFLVTPLGLFCGEKLSIFRRARGRMQFWFQSSLRTQKHGKT